MSWVQKSISSWLGLDKYVNPIYFESYSSEFFNPIADFADVSSDESKLKIILTNPAVLKVFALQCNMFSLGKVYVYSNDKEVKNDPLLKLLKRPNPFQQQSQFLWDFMFWKMLGNSYCYVDSDIVGNNSNKLYFLDSSKMTFPTEMQNMRDKIILSSASERRINDFNIKYTYKDGSYTTIKWSKIIHIPDLTNGTGNWFRGNSKIDALAEIAQNAKTSLVAKEINLDFSGKFIVSGKSDPDNISQLPLSQSEKNDVESKMNGNKRVHAMKSLVEIKRFIENIGALKLDESYLASYFLIGSMYDIPKDVLEAFNSGTYENQEKARGAHVSYCLSPAAEQLMGALAERFNYTDKEPLMDWEHLPFMQAFAKERAETHKLESESLLNLMKAGVKIDEINSILDLNLTQLDYVSAQRQSTGAGSNGQIN